MGKTKVNFTTQPYRLLIGGVGATEITTKAEAASIGTFKESNVLSIDTLPDGNNIVLTVSKKFSLLQNAFNNGSSVSYFFDVDGALIDCDTNFHEFYNVADGLSVFYSPTIASLGNEMFDANFSSSPNNFIEYCFTPEVITLGTTVGDNRVFRSNSTNLNLYVDTSLNGVDADLTARTYNSITYATPTVRIDTVGTITEGVNAGGQIELTWSAPTATGNIDAYFVFQDYSFIDSVTTETITINKLTNSTTSISIIAIDDQGNYSKMSNGQKFTFVFTPMTMIIDTTNVTSAVSATDTIILPFVSGQTVNLEIDWGDGGSLETYTDTNNLATHTYTTGGTYTVEIYNLNGTSVIPFNMKQTDTTRQDFSKFTEISQFGDCYLDNATLGDGLFYYMINLDITASDLYANVIQQNTSGSQMFTNCDNLTTAIDASAWDMSSYTSTYAMFTGASNVAWDFQNWDLTSCTTTESMFSYLPNVNINTTGWTIDPTVLTTAEAMFQICGSYNRDVSWLDPDGNDISFQDTFRQATSFTGTGIDTWDGSAVTNYTGTFRDATSFDADVTDLISSTTPIAVYVDNMFYNAASFLGVGLDGWDVSEVTSMAYLFYETNAMNTVTNLTGWDTSKVTSFGYTFHNNWTGTLDFTWMDVSSAVSMTRTWGNREYTPDVTGLTFATDCSFVQTFLGDGPQPIGLNTWGGTGFMQTTVGMFQNGTGLTDLDLSAWNVGDVGSFTNMFSGCTNWNPSAIFTMTNSANSGLNTMFSGCSSFNLDLSSWDFTFAASMTGFGLNWGMDTTNYGLLLNELSSQTLQSGLTTTMTSTYDAGEVDSGTADGTTANQLDDSSNAFLGVSIGDIVYNTTDLTYAEVTAVASGVLTLDEDIMVSGDTYSIQGSTVAKSRYDITYNDGWTLTDGGPAPEPTVLIGGLGSEVTDVDELADLFTFDASDVQSFKIDSNNDISFYIGISYSPDYNAFNTLKTGGFSDAITFYNDKGGFINSDFDINANDSSIFYLQTNLHTAWIENVTSSGADLFRQCYGLTYVRLDNIIEFIGDSQLRINDATLSQLKRIYIPRATSITGNNTFRLINSGTIIYHESTMSSNTQLLEAQNTYGAILTSVTDFTVPDFITNLSSANITSTTVDLNFTAPTSTNTLDFYEVWIDDGSDNMFQANTINQEITASGDTITGLLTGTTYTIKVVACDIYWNRSDFSNRVTITTL